MLNPKNIFSTFIPEAYRPLLSCISPTAFKVVQWQEVLKEAPKIAHRITSGEGIGAVVESLTPLIPQRVKIVIDKKSKSEIKNTLQSSDGAEVLAIYFSQLKNNKGLFLDLRASNFSLGIDGNIEWRPNGLWTCFQPSFRNGMLAIYDGYYLQNHEQLREGLRQVGLIKDHFSSAMISEVESMILSHVGGDTANQKFNVLHFTQSFEKLFQFLQREKITLSSDFLFLGVYLASLYFHLEALGGSYDVKKIYLSTRQDL